MPVAEMDFRPVQQAPTEGLGKAVLIKIEPPKLPIEVEMTTLSDAFEGTVELGTLATPLVRVVEAIRVRFFHDGDQVVVEAPELEEFGYGADAAQARFDLQRAIVELFHRLRVDRERLGSDLAKTLSVLERKLKPVTS